VVEESNDDDDAAPVQEPRQWQQLHDRGMSCMLRFFHTNEDEIDRLLPEVAKTRDDIAAQLRLVIGKESEEDCRMAELQNILHGLTARLELAVQARQTQALVRSDCHRYACVLKIDGTHETLINGMIRGGAVRLIMPVRDVMEIFCNSLHRISHVQATSAGRVDKSCIAQDLLQVVPKTSWKLLRRGGNVPFQPLDDPHWLQALEFDQPTLLSSERYQFNTVRLSSWQARIHMFQSAVERVSQNAYAKRSANSDAYGPMDIEMVARNPAEQTCLQMRC
jgi:hypothetical protein